ncbi:MAG: tripartite tricarboxylate transporter family receptor [Clostridiales bacterium]|jgi:tripartite-type tricarboxylate transporter receptor subunit TctC|nr:tripartite tricarboxylate transporter family receptor [Clostridiales bacterium]
MKKFLSIALIFALSLGTLAGCNQKTNKNNESKEQTQSNTTAAAKKIDYPTRPIKVIVSGSAGGASDIGMRAIAPFLEKELGQPITIENNAGGSGWIAWTDLATAKPDGYTLGIINIPALPAGYLDPKMKRNLSLQSYTPIANNVSDFGVIAIRKDEKRFSNIKEVIEFAKKNEITATTGAVAGDDHIAILKINKAFNSKLLPIHGKSTPEYLASFLGGHVDILFANVSEVTALQKNNELKVIAVMSKERSPYLPNVPTLEESGFTGVLNGSSRGFAGPAGMDPNLVAFISSALEKSMKNPEYVKKMKEIGLEIDYKNSDGFKKFIADEEEKIKSMKDLLGY